MPVSIYVPFFSYLSILTSSKQNTMQPLRRPNRSTNSPKKVPKTAAELKPVKKSAPTSTPYDWYSVYMLVPCSQSASITVRYTERYMHWNLFVAPHEDRRRPRLLLKPVNTICKPGYGPTSIAFV